MSAVSASGFAQTVRPAAPEFDASVYLVTDPVLAGSRGVLDVVAAAVAGGVTCVQLRDKAASAAGLLELLLRAAEVVAGRATLLIDDRVDVFLAARAAGAAVHGVHIGQSDLPVREVRALVDTAAPVDPAGRHAIVGLTANTPEHLSAVRALPPGTVDYLGVGVIRPTTTKADHPEPLGIAGFAALAAATDLPCVAIGGIRTADVGALRRAGAAGVAVASEIMAAPNPTLAARAIAAEWAQALKLGAGA